MKKILIIISVLILLAIGGYLYFQKPVIQTPPIQTQTREMVFGADSGALSPGTMADDATVGEELWEDVNNAKISDNVYAINYFSSNGFDIPIDTSVKIVKSNGAFGATNKATNSQLTTTDTYKSFGSSSDLWVENWAYTDINDVDFGIGISYTNTSISHYLKATNFGFNIPAGATINGILVEVEANYYDSVDYGKWVQVDHIRITVYYTAGASNSCTYSGTGDWFINQADACYETANVYVNGAVNLYGSATGMLDCAPGIKISAKGWNFGTANGNTRVNANCIANHQ